MLDARNDQICFKVHSNFFLSILIDSRQLFTYSTIPREAESRAENRAQRIKGNWLEKLKKICSFIATYLKGQYTQNT